MAIKTTDPDALIDAVNVTISATMNDTVMEFCKDLLSNTVHAYVYPIYEPDSYVRREDAGGISDKREYETEEDGNPWGNEHTITIGDYRREANVVNSGSGYTWTRSRIYKWQPWPRPYFAQADSTIQKLLDGMMQGLMNSL